MIMKCKNWIIPDKSKADSDDSASDDLGSGTHFPAQSSPEESVRKQCTPSGVFRGGSGGSGTPHGRLRLDKKSIIRQYRNLQRAKTKSNIISHYTVHVLRTTNHTDFETF